jgi:hypothetical protein
MPDEVSEKTPELSISPEKVLLHHREGARIRRQGCSDPDDASNPADDVMISVLEDHRDDPVVQEIAAAIFGMSEDEP